MPLVTGGPDVKFCHFEFKLDIGVLAVFRQMFLEQFELGGRWSPAVTVLLVVSWVPIADLDSGLCAGGRSSIRAPRWPRSQRLRFSDPSSCS